MTENTSLNQSSIHTSRHYTLIVSENDIMTPTLLSPLLFVKSRESTINSVEKDGFMKVVEINDAETCGCTIGMKSVNSEQKILSNIEIFKDLISSLENKIKLLTDDVDFLRKESGNEKNIIN